MPVGPKVVPASAPAPDQRVRTKLLVGTALLAVMQLVHLLDVLRYDETASFPALLGDPLAVFGIGAATVAFVWTVQRRRTARAVALATGAAIAVGFVLVHGFPVELDGFNNPYWTKEGNRADRLQWASVLVLVVLGAWTARTAWNGSSTTGSGAQTLR